ncbi:MAG: hypothetical protein JRN10_07680 [Nitrososphaerota archaeon]|nr:hypothetical protein [Nitrososphaerota archaeon]
MIQDAGKLPAFTVFIACTLVIILLTMNRSLFLLAPPYDVTAYLLIVEPRVKFSRPLSVFAS